MSFHSPALTRERVGVNPAVMDAQARRDPIPGFNAVGNGAHDALGMNHISDVLSGGGRPLDMGTRHQMESGFNHDFSGVRIHTGEEAARSAGAVDARAYTVQNDIVFGAGQHQPDRESGRELMAHELAHVVQQSRGGADAGPESRAAAAARRVTQNQSVSAEAVGGAAPGLYANGEEGETETASSTATPAATPAATPTATPTTPRLTLPAFSLGWDSLARLGMLRRPPSYLLTPPPVLAPMPLPPLSSPTRPPGAPTLPTPALTPPAPTAGTGTPAGAGTPASEAPSRLPIPGASRGSFSLGLRLGFPELSLQRPEGMPESPLAASLRQATIMSYVLSGETPSGWEAVDTGLLTRAIWGILSENIAPDLTRSITSSLATPTGPGGLSLELDVVLITDFSSEIGGGLSLTIRH